MTERVKLMGKLEVWLGVVYGGLIGAYTAGIPIDMTVLILAGMFTAAYFGHWAMTLLEMALQNQQILKQLEFSRDDKITD